MSIKLIVGLRNPGTIYQNTRHNVGGWLAETLVRRFDSSFKINKKLNGELAEIVIDGMTIRVLQPLSFMNHSGVSVSAVCQFYRLTPNEVLVIHDELDLDAGRIKLKTGGGHGGHNGLRDIIQQVGGCDFHRLRLGISHPGHKDLVHNYVLGKPSSADRLLLFDAIDRAIAVMPIIAKGDLQIAMTKLNC